MARLTQPGPASSINSGLLDTGRLGIVPALGRTSSKAFRASVSSRANLGTVFAVRAPGGQDRIQRAQTSDKRLRTDLAQRFFSIFGGLFRGCRVARRLHSSAFPFRPLAGLDAANVRRLNR